MEIESEFNFEENTEKKTEDKEKNIRKDKQKKKGFVIRYYYYDKGIRYVDYKVSYDGRYKREVPKITIKFSNGKQRTMVIGEKINYEKFYKMKFWLTYRIERGRLKSIPLGTNLETDWNKSPLKFTTFFRTRQDIKEDRELLSMIETSLFLWLYIYHEGILKRYIYGKEVYLFSKYSYKRFHPYMSIKFENFGININKKLLFRLMKLYKTELMLKQMNETNYLRFDWIERKIKMLEEEISKFLSYDILEDYEEKEKLYYMRLNYLRNNPFKDYKLDDYDKIGKAILMIDYGYEIIEV